MSQQQQRTWIVSAGIALLSMVVSGAAAPAVQDFPLRETTGLIEQNVKAEAVEYLGRRAVKLTRTEQQQGQGLAFLPGVEFQDGVIEVDIAAKVVTPPGVRMPGFIGIAFRSRPDGSKYELFYIRPRNARAADQAMRNHAVQYSSEPGFGWYPLRRAWPWVYEAHAHIDEQAWTHVKIEVAGRTAKLSLNNAPEPTLIVDGLKGEDLKGSVGLWPSQGQESGLFEPADHPRHAAASEERVGRRRGVGGVDEHRLRTVQGRSDADAERERAERDVDRLVRPEPAGERDVARGVRRAHVHRRLAAGRR